MTGDLYGRRDAGRPCFMIWADIPIERERLVACAIPLRAVRDRGALVRRFSGAQFGAVSLDRAAQGTAEIVGMCGVRWLLRGRCPRRRRKL